MFAPKEQYQSSPTISVDQAALQASFASVKGTVGCDQVAELETDLKPVGDKLLGRCSLPDHKDRELSFYCYLSKTYRGFYDSWWCFGCARGGDVVDLYNAQEGPFVNAVVALHALADRFDLKLWRDEGFVSDFQLAAIRARNRVEAARDRALTKWYFQREVVPLARAIKDEAERKAFLEDARTKAGLTRMQMPSPISRSKARRVRRSAV
jgi:CHC2 zinc finger